MLGLNGKPNCILPAPVPAPPFLPPQASIAALATTLPQTASPTVFLQPWPIHPASIHPIFVLRSITCSSSSHPPFAVQSKIVHGLPGDGCRLRLQVLCQL